MLRFIRMLEDAPLATVFPSAVLQCMIYCAPMAMAHAPHPMPMSATRIFEFPWTRNPWEMRSCVSAYGVPPNPPVALMREIIIMAIMPDSMTSTLTLQIPTLTLFVDDFDFRQGVEDRWNYMLQLDFSCYGP